MIKFDPADRRTYIGGSEAYAACGMDPYKPRATLYFEKTGRIKTRVITSDEIEAGDIMEPVVANQFQKRFQIKVVEYPELHRHPAYPWMGAHIDRLIKSPEGLGFLECKNTKERFAFEWKDDQVPEKVIFQVQHYMAVLKVEYCWVGACIGGFRFVFKRIEADKALQELIIAKEREFWNMVNNRIEPELEQAIQDDPSLARRLFPRSDGTDDVDLNSISDCIQKAQELNIKIKADQKDLIALRSKIRALIKDAPHGHTDTHLVSYTHYDNWELDVKRLKKELPNVYKKYVTKTPVRRLVIKQSTGSPDDETINFLDGTWDQEDPFNDIVFD